MPLYTYKCPKCSEVKEVLQKNDASDLFVKLVVRFCQEII